MTGHRSARVFHHDDIIDVEDRAPDVGLEG
jgi:hypothetical protein